MTISAFIMLVQQVLYEEIKYTINHGTGRMVHCRFSFLFRPIYTSIYIQLLSLLAIIEQQFIKLELLSLS